jgi:serine protease Do
MKKSNLFWLLCLVLATDAAAQQKTTAPLVKEEKKEIVVESGSGNKKEKMVIVVDNGKVTINGKPAEEYKGKQRIVINDDIVVNGRAMAPRNGSRVMVREASPRAFLGVSTTRHEKGAEVTEVVEETAAAKAGLKKGDIITAINATNVAESESLLAAVRKHKPEETVDVTYLRDGKEKKVKATLGKTDDATAFTIDSDYRENLMKERENVMREIELQNEALRELRIPRGYVFPDNGNFSFNFGGGRPKFGMGVEDNPDGDGAKVSTITPESNAAKAGLLKDDVITDVDGKSIKTVDDLREILAESREKPSLSMKVLRNGKTETITLRVPKVLKSADL